MPDLLNPSPAPWRIVWATTVLAMVVGSDGSTVAAVDGPNAENNAALISVAPELRDALALMVDHRSVDLDASAPDYEIVEQARAILARANGGAA